MSTLNEVICSRCSIAPTCPVRSHFQHTLNRKRRSRVRINVTAHQEKDKNKKTGKKELGEERKQPTDFKEAACRPSEVVQRAARRKMVCMRKLLGVPGILEKANSHFDPTQTESETASPR